MHDLSVTLVAVATPPGRGGVGCVRISGPDAVAVAGRLFRPARGAAVRPGARPRFGRFLDRKGRAVDHGFLVVFPPGSAFTGESSAELWPHGSPAVLRELVGAAVAAGAVPAGPGEFTYRALRNGRLGLDQAEAVRDLVAARTLYQARVAFSQAEGELSRRLAPLREGLADLIARAEAALEFVEESDVHLPSGELERGLGKNLRLCTGLLDGYARGRLVREGAAVVIAGRPNVGKSSLFNRLLARERAIVTEMPGTTRDTLEEAVDLEGVPVTLIDTAGLRDAGHPVEDEGIRRAAAAAREADLVLLVLDGSRPPDAEERGRLERPSAEDATGPPTLLVVNKSDLPESAEFGATKEALRVSAKTGDGLDRLREALRERLLGADPIEDPVLTDARHARALSEAREALARAVDAHRRGLSEEFVLEDLREAVRRVGTITGEFTTDDLYDRIFSTFCIGK